MVVLPLEGRRSHTYQSLITRVLSIGIKRKAAAPPAEIPEEQNIMGKDYFRNPEVNEGFYSFKRAGVADVDPKVSNRHNSNRISNFVSFQTGYGAIPSHPRKAPAKSRHRQTEKALRFPRHRGALARTRKLISTFSPIYVLNRSSDLFGFNSNISIEGLNCDQYNLNLI